MYRVFSIPCDTRINNLPPLFAEGAEIQKFEEKMFSLLPHSK